MEDSVGVAQAHSVGKQLSRFEWLRIFMSLKKGYPRHVWNRRQNLWNGKGRLKSECAGDGWIFGALNGHNNRFFWGELWSVELISIILKTIYNEHAGKYFEELFHRFEIELKQKRPQLEKKQSSSPIAKCPELDDETLQLQLQHILKKCMGAKRFK